MHIVVCCKQVIDPELPPSRFRLDAIGNKAEPVPGVLPVISPFDEQAVEAALQIKDAVGGKVTVISLETDPVLSVVKKPLAMGADVLVLLRDEAFGGGDSWSTACALAAAIRRLDDFNLILCGQQASDTNGGQVGSIIAEILGIPSVICAKRVELVGDAIRVERVVTNGFEVVETSLPAALTISSELGEARIPTLRGIMRSKSIEPVVFAPGDLGLDPQVIGAQGRRTRIRSLVRPIRAGRCEMIGGKTPEEMGSNLALKLREIQVI